ncbi:DNA polymerase III subunit delta' [Weissella viridescens]|uniref:DNA polymerase III subunit delta n=1 Tax=Weissella viridescens TaxID=1629 RepID=A0A3P2RGE6_WEIVI|nr:DNA polymerase III subunit delta' [Weissella viridescens]RRG18585.1 DNA polymerase III subunit delta' [Weissella viridescens]
MPEATQAATVIATAHHDQPQIIANFESAIAQNQLGHAFMFVGPNGRGQAEVADWLAMRLLCLHPTETGDPDGTCNQCVRIAQHEHPDVVEVAPEGNSLKVDQIRFLQGELSKTAVEGQRKVLIIHAAETMTSSAANGLLKSMEEPQGQQTIILIAKSRQQMLPTIISRSQVIEFNALPAEQVQAQLQNMGYSPANAQLAQHLTDDMTQAQEWLVDDWFDRARQGVEHFMTALLCKDLQTFTLVQTELMPLAKEQSIKVLVDMIIQATRDTLLARQGRTVVSGFTALPQWQQVAQTLTDAQWLQIVDLALMMPRALDMNLNPQTTLESFVLKSQKAMAS